MTGRLVSRAMRRGAGLLAAVMVLAATPGLACGPSPPPPSPAPSGGGDTTASSNNNGGGRSDGRGNDNGGAQGERQGAFNAAGADLDGNDNGGRRSGGGGGDQQSGNYTPQIDSLAAENQANAAEAASPKPSCADLQRHVDEAQGALTYFDEQNSHIANDIRSSQEAVQNLQAGKWPVVPSEQLDDQLSMWTDNLKAESPVLRQQAKMMVAYLAELKLMGTGDRTPLITYYQQALNKSQAEAAQADAKRQPLAQNLESLQAKLRDCQSQQ